LRWHWPHRPRSPGPGARCHNWHHDDTIYRASAKSLAEGHGYRIASLPGEPFQTKYPPVLPLLLALLWKLAPGFPENLHLATLFAWLMIVPYLFCMRALFRAFQLRAWEVKILTIAAAWHPVICLLSTVLMSYLLFLALFLAGLLLAERALQSDESAWLAYLSGLTVGIAVSHTHSRSAGHRDIPALLFVSKAFTPRSTFYHWHLARGRRMAGYHYAADERLALPLYPLALIGFWTEAKHFWKLMWASWNRRRITDQVAAAMAAALLAGVTVFIATAYAVGDTAFLPALFRRGQARLEAYREAYSWIRIRTAPESVFYAYDDPLLYLYTGRHALGFTMPSGRIYSGDAKRQADRFVTAVPERARAHGLDYVMLTASDFHREEHTQPPSPLASHGPKLRQEFAAAHVVIYRTLP
jgi:hypothetical protein